MYFDGSGTDEAGGGTGKREGSAPEGKEIIEHDCGGEKQETFQTPAVHAIDG
jgi:hypothetical protein